MGVSVLVLGESGSGKSTSLQNFEQGEIGIFNVASKPLPFRSNLDKLDGATYTQIGKSLKHNSMRAYAIDDANYLMAFENFAKSEEKGYDKFTKMAVHFFNLLMAANGTSKDTIVYFLMHPQTDDYGRMRPKTIGKMLDNQLCVEGMFPIVLVANNDEMGFQFIVSGGAGSPAKAPIGMFSAPAIDNDLYAVDRAIREYWQMAPLTDIPRAIAEARS